MMTVASAIAQPMSKGFLTRWGRRTVAVALALTLVSVGCSDQADRHLTMPLKQARNIVVELDAMPGAIPSFAPLSVGVSPWLVLEYNLRALAPPTLEGLVSPRSAQEVGPLDAAGYEFSNQQILALADQHRDIQVGADEAHLHVLFLDGKYAEDTQQSLVRALHLGGTRIIAVFGAVSAHSSDYERVAEQAAIVHEFGHAFGLVDLGIPAAPGHVDAESAQHCAEPDCVMRAYATFPSQAHHFLKGGPPPVLFGPKCLDALSDYYE